SSACFFSLFSSSIVRPPTSTLFPYTTLFRSILDPANPNRIYVAISAAGAFRSDDGGASWVPINRGLRSGEIPDEDSEVGHCVHRSEERRVGRCRSAPR